MSSTEAVFKLIITSLISKDSARRKPCGHSTATNGDVEEHPKNNPRAPLGCSWGAFISVKHKIFSNDWGWFYPRPSVQIKTASRLHFHQDFDTWCSTFRAFHPNIRTKLKVSLRAIYMKYFHSFLFRILMTSSFVIPVFNFFIQILDYYIHM